MGMFVEIVALQYYSSRTDWKRIHDRW